MACCLGLALFHPSLAPGQQISQSDAIGNRTKTKKGQGSHRSALEIAEYPYSSLLADNDAG